MLEKFRTFEQAVRDHVPARYEADRVLAEQERAQVLATFPLSAWPELPLMRFAQGTGGSERSFCAWMEQATSHIAAMPAWKAEVHIIYKGTDGVWHYPDAYSSEKAAWKGVRAGYVEAFALAQGGDASSIDGLTVFQPGRLTLHKALAVYFPDRFLPICATEHLRILAQRVLRERWNKSTHGTMGHMALNALLLQELRAVPALAGQTPWQLMRFLYDWTGPKEKDGRLPRVYKIAPGDGAKHWEACRDGGYICVGWDEMGDLTLYKGDWDRFLAAFTGRYKDTLYKGHLPTTTRKAKELWSLTSIESGAVIVANRGINEIVGVGEVEAPGYLWLGARDSYRHGLRVRWGPMQPRRISPQGYWANVTVLLIGAELFDEVLRTAGGSAMARPDLPLNCIYYGPPGTGKTWKLRNEVEPKFQPRPEAPVAPPSSDPVEPLPWWRAVALALQRRQPCTAAELVGDPLIEARRAASSSRSNLARFVGNVLNQHTVKDSETVGTSRRVAPFLFDKDEQGRWFLRGEIPAAQAGPAVALLAPGAEATRPVERSLLVTFHPSFTYEDFVVGIRPSLGEMGDEDDTEVPTLRYEQHYGVFYRACERALEAAGWAGTLEDFCAPGPAAATARKSKLKDAPGVLLAIDEINRGNIARILGELITLIEKDKRLGEEHELIVTLPGTGQRFGVPSNLWIVGTMNTADRSVVAMDTALRRRFVFEEMPPQPDLLVDENKQPLMVEGVDLKRLLETTNERLVRLKDDDHQIGHSFFWDIKTKPERRTIHELRRVFRDHLLPLLREYFYDDLGRVGLVLGSSFVEVVKANKKVFAKDFEHELVEDLAERVVYRLKPVEEVDAAGFQSIYA